MGSSFSFSSPERLSCGPEVVAGVSAPDDGPGVATGVSSSRGGPRTDSQVPTLSGQGRRAEYPNLQLGGSAWEKFLIRLIQYRLELLCLILFYLPCLEGF